MEIIAGDLGLQYRIHIILLFLQFVKQDCPTVFLFDFHVKFLQDRYELFFMDGLQDIIINPVLDCLLRVFKIAVACKKDNMGLILQFPDFFNQVNPIHARHGNVHNGQVILLLCKKLQGPCPIPCLVFNFIPHGFPVKSQNNSLPDQHFIIHNHYLEHSHSP